MDRGRIKVLMVTIALVLFLHISVGVEKQTARNFSGGIAQNYFALAQERSKVVSVKAFGAKGDGVADGGNKAANNRIVGKPRQGWTLSSLQSSDSVEQ